MIDDDDYGEDVRMMIVMILMGSAGENYSDVKNVL